MELRRIGLGTFILAICLTSCGKKQNTSQEAPPQKYPTIVLQQQDVELQSVYPAIIRGQEDIEIRPRIDGYIDAIHVDEGSRVKKGQSLFKINSPASIQNVTTAEAAVLNAEAQMNTAKLNVERMRTLAEKDIIGQVQFQTVQNAYESANASLRQAEATLTNARESLSWTEVKSPVDGLVGSIPYRLGSLVNSTNILTTVANTNNVFAYYSLNEKELSTFLGGLTGTTQQEKIKNIPEVTLTLADGTVYPEKGRVETITGSVDIATGAASFRAEFPNKQGQLRSGTSGKVSIPKVIEDVYLIPQKATIAQQNKTLIYVVQGDSVMQRPISVISTPDGKSYAVTEGLKTGDRIVTDGVATLSNGKKIQVSE